MSRPRRAGLTTTVTITLLLVLLQLGLLGSWTLGHAARRDEGAARRHAELDALLASARAEALAEVRRWLRDPAAGPVPVTESLWRAVRPAGRRVAAPTNLPVDCPQAARLADQAGLAAPRVTASLVARDPYLERPQGVIELRVEADGERRIQVARHAYTLAARTSSAWPAAPTTTWSVHLDVTPLAVLDPEGSP